MESSERSCLRRVDGERARALLLQRRGRRGKAGVVGSPGEFDVPHFLQPLCPPPTVPPLPSLPYSLPLPTGSPLSSPSPRNVSRFPSTNEGPPDEDTSTTTMWRASVAFNVSWRRGMEDEGDEPWCISASWTRGCTRRKGGRGRETIVVVGFFFVSNGLQRGGGGIRRVSGGNSLVSEGTGSQEERCCTKYTPRVIQVCVCVYRRVIDRVILFFEGYWRNIRRLDLGLENWFRWNFRIFDFFFR